MTRAKAKALCPPGEVAAYGKQERGADGPIRAELWIGEIPPSLNEWRLKHWGYRYDMNDRWHALVRVAARDMVLFTKPVIVTVRYSFKDRRSRDPDNMTPKFIMDGLKTRVIPDDSCVYVRRLVLEIRLKQPELGTEVIVERAEND